MLFSDGQYQTGASNSEMFEITVVSLLPWIRDSPTKKAQQTERRKGTSGHLRRGFSNDRTNQIITFQKWNLV